MIESLDNKLGAFETVFSDDAMRQAHLADIEISAGSYIGPLLRIPFAIKDIFDLEGTICTKGSLALKKNRSECTGTVVQRLISAGGIIIGKTKTVEHAFGGWGTNQKMGTPWNPWDTKNHRIPGGSSSGSAVATAAKMAVFAIGSDTGGSIRLPAAFCGITGLKLTEGTIPCDGIMPLSKP